MFYKDLMWLKKVVLNPENKTIHRPAIIKLIDNFYSKWGMDMINDFTKSHDFLDLQADLSSLWEEQNGKKST